MGKEIGKKDQELKISMIEKNENLSPVLPPRNGKAEALSSISKKQIGIKSPTNIKSPKEQRFGTG